MPDYYFKVRILKYVSHNYYDFHMSMNFAEESTNLKLNDKIILKIAIISISVNITLILNSGKI